MADTKVNKTRVKPIDFSTCKIPLHELEQPLAGEAHIWYLNLGRLGMSLQHALGGDGEGPEELHLSPAQLRFSRRFYLRLLLGAYLGIPGKSVKINRSNRGKPSLDQSEHRIELHFSMAKSRDRLLIGISKSILVGVDLEPADRRANNALGVARRYFTATEAQSLEKISPQGLDGAFLRDWACKEAVVKASGQGIANQFCRFTVEIDPALPPAVLDFEDEDPANWSLVMVQPGEGYLGAVAMHHGKMELKAFKLV